MRLGAHEFLLFSKRYHAVPARGRNMSNKGLASLNGERKGISLCTPIVFAVPSCEGPVGKAGARRSVPRVVTIPAVHSRGEQTIRLSRISVDSRRGP